MSMRRAIISVRLQDLPRQPVIPLRANPAPIKIIKYEV
jgi:hypothetical protein